MRNCVISVGDVFERLSVIKREESDKHGTSRWLCRCECGNEKIVLSSSLSSKRVMSCGCLNKELARKRKFKNLINQCFGFLVVIKQENDYISSSGQHQSMWLCKCKCGIKKIINTKHLTSGKIKS